MHRFTGAFAKQYDTASSLILMGARPYDPALGRFLEVDPVDGGSLNNYDYAGQDPLNKFDLDGLMMQNVADGGCATSVCPISSQSSDGAGLASPQEITNHLAGGKVNWHHVAKVVVGALKSYGVSCLVSGGIAAGVGAAGGFVVGCAGAIFQVAVDKHASPNKAAVVDVILSLETGKRVVVESRLGKGFANALGQALCAALHPACASK